MLNRSSNNVIGKGCHYARRKSFAQKRQQKISRNFAKQQGSVPFEMIPSATKIYVPSKFEHCVYLARVKCGEHWAPSLFSSSSSGRHLRWRGEYPSGQANAPSKRPFFRWSPRCQKKTWKRRCPLCTGVVIGITEFSCYQSKNFFLLWRRRRLFNISFLPSTEVAPWCFVWLGVIIELAEANLGWGRAKNIIPL